MNAGEQSAIFSVRDNNNEMVHRTSVTLYQRHVDFMEQESKNMSKFVRTLLDEHIEQADDYDFQN